MRSIRLFVPLLACLLIVGFAVPMMGQGETIITIAIQEWMSDVFNDKLFDAFEAEHPGVKVVTVPVGNSMYYSSAAWMLEEHLDSAQEYTSKADVLTVSSYTLSPEATRAGYFLDLTPLVNSDPSFNADDFFPAALKSFQWDGATWGIPLSVSTQLLIYNKKAFDDAGLTYPDERWTLDDLAVAARTLTTYDEDGDVDVPGMEFYNVGLLFRTILGEGFYDNTIIPNPPKFDHPELPALLETWIELQNDLRTNGQYDYNAVPMSLNTPWKLTNPDGEEWGASLLPGGTAGVDVQGYAVSAGTANPELAYELAKFVSSDPLVVQRMFANSPARRSLVGVEVEDSNVFMPALPDEVQALIERAVEVGIPTSELRYNDYLNMAIASLSSEGQIDTQAMVEEAEAKALEAMETAAARRGATILFVSTPVPTPSFGADQMLLNFGLSFYTSELPNQPEWDRLVTDFLATHPAVGNVNLTTQFFSQDGMETVDCYYQPSNAVPYLELEDYISLDPFMDADPAFDRGDFIGDTLTQMQREGRTWGYPISIQPQILWYNYEIFNEQGLPAPEDGWSIDEFRDALEQLKGTLEDEDAPVFRAESFGNTYLLMLIAAYGGVPYDYRTDPPTINFNEPDTVDAIRQILDLAKEGYINYQQLVSNGGMFGGFGAPILSESLTGFSWRLRNRIDPVSSFQEPYFLTTYPYGNEFTPVAYDIGAAYIQDHAQNPEICYQFIAYIAQRPDLFAAIPARRSQLTDPSLSAAWGADMAALYQTFGELIESPNALILTRQYAGNDSFNTYVEPMWLNKAFDNYVLNGGDLETELATAQQRAEEYRECVSGIPEVNLAELDTPEASQAHYRQFTDCAISVDPSMQEWFSWYYQEVE